MKKLHAIIGLAILGTLAINPASAQTYPDRPVRIVLPFAAGGVADITARIVAEALGQKLNARFVVENTPGAGGIAAARAVLSSPADGYTIAMLTNGTSISVPLFKSLPYDPTFAIEDPDLVQAIFWGLGSDGTVSANKSSIKIIGEETPNYAQGYFVYDSKKSGARTTSHLRFGPRPIQAPYLIRKAGFVGVHQFGFLERFDVLAEAEPGAADACDHDAHPTSTATRCIGLAP